MEKLLFFVAGIACFIAALANAAGIVPGMAPSPIISMTFCAVGVIAFAIALLGGP